MSRRAHGQVRRGQVITTYGPGALIDLPRHSAIVGGLDTWPKASDLEEILEPRLTRKLEMMTDVAAPRLYAPPPEELGSGAFQNGSSFRRRERARSESDPAGWSIARASTKKDASMAALWLRPDLCALARRVMSTTSIGSALCTGWKIIAGGSYGSTKEVQAAIWLTSSCGANAANRAVSTSPRYLK